MKLNIKNLCLLIIMIMLICLFLINWINIIIFNGTLTEYKLIINVLEIAIAIIIEYYLSNYLDIKNEK